MMAVMHLQLMYGAVWKSFPTSTKACPCYHRLYGKINILSTSTSFLLQVEEIITE